MKLIFTRARASTTSWTCSATTVSFEQVACPKQGIIPHDMVHYAVEHAAGAAFPARVGEGESAISA